MTSSVRDDSDALYEAEVARFRKTLSTGRSATQLALFDLLVARSNDERPPKEIEIAIALFGENATVDSGGDSGVRVYVHRLRKRMEDYYALTNGPRLVIPKGAYRIALETAVSSPAPAPAPPLWWHPMWWRRFRQIDLSIVFGVGIIACAAAGLAGWLLWPASNTQPATEMSLGSSILVNATSDPFRPVIAIGDNMLLARSDDQRSVRQMILDPAVRSRDDFGTYLKAHPETFYKLYDFNLQFAPISAMEAGWAVADFLQGAARKEAAPVPLLPASALTDDMLATRDILFVGRLSQLRTLATDVFMHSQFALVGDDRLVNNKTGKSFSTPIYAGPQPGVRTDYGYLAVGTGSTGHRLIVLSGIGDSGTEGVAAVLRSPQALAQIRRTVGGARRFEALFAITAVNGTTSQHRLIAAYPLP